MIKKGAMKTRKRDLFFVFLLLLVVGSICFGQNKPSPQQENWTGVIKPTNYTQAELNTHVSSYYDYWRTSYLRAANTGGYYILGDATNGNGNEKGTSEGHGYGMLITTLMAGYDNDAKTYYDGLYQYFNTHRSTINNELMGWLVDTDENSNSYSSATDGDMDIAYSLILAHYQWGSNGTINYLQEAKDMISNGLKGGNMNETTKRTMLGDWGFLGDNASRPSDWMTAQLHAYAQTSNDPFFDEVRDEIYNMMDVLSANHAPNTGLMPDFVEGTPIRPVAPGFLEGANDGDYFYNAGRLPWRVSMDYGHFGSTRSKGHMVKLVDWIQTQVGNDPSQIKAGYKLDGTPIGDYFDATFVAPLVAASTVDSKYQTFLNNGWDDIRNSKVTYFADNINLLCMLYISGNWWVPQDVNSVNCLTAIDLEDDELCESNQLTLDTKLNDPKYTFTWSKDGNAFGTNSPQVTVTDAGVYQVQIAQDGCTTFSKSATVSSLIPNVSDVTLTCNDSQLSVDGGMSNLIWTDASDNIIGQGQTLNYDVTSDQTIYVQYTTGSGGSTTLTQQDFQNVDGWFNDDTEFDYSVIFDMLQSGTLNSVSIVSQGAQTITVELRTSTGTLLASKSVNLSAGENTVNLGFNIDAANNLELMVEGTTANLFVNNALTQPLTEAGKVSIKSTKASWGNNDWLAYFNNWTFSFGQTCLKESFDVTISGGTVGSPSITIAADETSICQGETVNFSIDAQSNEGNNPTYEWFVNGASVETGNTYSSNSLNDGSKVSVELTSDAACLTTTEATSNELTIIVASSVTPSLTIAADKTEICEGETINFSIDSQSNQGTNSTYEWFIGSASQGTGARFSSSSLSDGNSVSATLTSNAACATSTDASSNNISIVVNDLVNPSIAIQANETTICNGETVNFSITAQTNQGTNPSYEWFIGNASQGTGTTFSSSSLANNDVVSAVLTSNAACLINSTSASNYVRITTSGNITPLITITPSDNTICAGQAIAFSANVAGGGSNPTYDWKVNGNSVSSNPNYTSNAWNDGDVINCELTSSSNCATTTTALSNSETINVIQNVTPSINITASETSICASETVDFSTSITNGGNAAMVKWTINGNLFGNGETITMSSLSNSDVVRAVLTSNETCVTNSQATSNNVTITVNDAVQASINISLQLNTFPVCAGNDITFNANGQNLGTSTIEWFANDEKIAEGTSLQIESQDQDVIQAKAISDLACANGNQIESNIITVEADECVSSLKELNDADYVAYPNPSRDYVNITGKSLEKIEITTIDGSTLLIRTIVGNNYQLNISELNTGAYFLKIYANGGTLTKQIIKK